MKAAGSAGDVGVFHPGTQHSWQTARALQEEGRLAWYATSIFFRQQHLPYRLLPLLPTALRTRAERELGRFYHPGLDPRLIRTFGIHEWIEKIVRRAGRRRVAAWVNAAGNAAFGRSVARLCRKEPVRALWGYDTSSLEAFRAAKRAGQFCILDRTIGDWRVYNRMMAEVFENYPEFFGEADWRIDQRVIEIGDAEYDLADAIVTGSEYCLSTIIDPEARPDVAPKLRVIEYCYDDHFFQHDGRAGNPVTHPLRFIFVGQVGARKGIHLLLRAFARIPESAASLTVIGDLQIPPATVAQYSDRVTFVPAVPRAAVAAYLREADCLVFPTYFEGAGLNLYEAAAVGLGIIQSRNAAIVATEQTGQILDELTEEAVYNAIMEAVGDLPRVAAWKMSASRTVKNNTFTSYQHRVATFVDELRVAAAVQG